MFQSPLKTVAEKIKPTDTKSSVSSLRFDRSSDFKKFIKFIKNETEQLEKIKLPTTTEIKGRGGSKLPGAAGILGLGLFGLIASLFGGDDKGKGDNKFRVGGAEASSIPTVPPLGLGSVVRKTPIKLATNKKLKLSLTKTEFESRKADLKKYYSRNKKIKEELIRNNKLFTDELKKRRKLKFARMREILGEKGFKREGYSFVPLKDFEIEKKFLEVVNKNKDIKILPGQIDQELANIISEEFQKKKIFFINPDDPKMTRALEKKIIAQEAAEELRKQIVKPITLEDVKGVEELAKPFKGMSELDKADMKEARALLNTPEFKTLLKEDKFQKITGTNTPKARSFFGGKFTPKYALDDFFTGVGEKTKGFRDFMSRPFMKSSGKPTGFGKALMPVMGFGSKLLKGGGFGLDLFSAIFATAELIDGFIVGDNILTAYYDLGVAVHNAFQPDKTKLMFYITKSRNAKKNAFTDKKNQEILQQINEAKKSQVNNNQVSAQEGSSGIVPFAKAVSSSPMGITMVPTIYSWKFITEKLYKQ